MAKPFLRILFLTTILNCSIKAQDGGQLYELYCSACHGMDGKGAGEGTFPPLAGSDWLQGNPKRAALVVLKGLEGPIEVSGKSFNLAMPPHEASLSLKNIQTILNYVNSSWGNNGPKIQMDVITVVASEFENRDKPWTAAELLELFPLPKQKTGLENIISRVYRGQWDKMPDFDKIEAENVEEEHNGIIDLSISEFKDNYGIVWEGDFIAETDGDYEFTAQADDGVRVILNDTLVAEVTGPGPVSPKRAGKGSISLKKGKNQIRIEYFENTRQQKIELRWRKSGSKGWTWLTKKKVKKSRNPSIILTPDDGKTAIYRNFIDGTTPRAIGFGFPGELNMAYSADNLAPELIWSGPFIDAGRHWTNRGQGNQPPAGNKVIKLTEKRYFSKNTQFKGYSLDENGNPTFHLQIDQQTLSDSWAPGAMGTLVRTLTLSGGNKPIEIPHGNPAITDSETVIVTPEVPEIIIYNLK
ncbi:PA14 domain-containing protein [Luteolibacter sp. AS25]|uniref:PA14 domain-containing protein n=1 Tax=Luteolibacter sp. AS25 TaxID=3135776 RepID=UPI00398B9E6B